MAWLDNYREAKFRNAVFHVPSASNEGGRRAVVHEFPNRETPYVQDMGRKARRHSVEAYIVDEDYMTDRDALIIALEKPGKGKLVHPYLGTMDVVCLSYSFEEKSSEMGMVRFSIQFAEAGTLKFPTTTIDTVSDVAAKKITALDQIKAFLAKTYNIASVPHSVAKNTLTTIDNSLSVIEDAKKTVSAVADFKRDLENTVGRIIAVAYDVVELGQNIVELMSYGTTVGDDYPADADNARAQFNEMRNMWGFAAPDVLLDNNDPAEVYSTFFQQCAVINAMSLLSIMEFDSLDEAVTLRDEVFTVLEPLMINTTDDDLYLALYNLQTAVIQDIDTRGSTLARLGSYTLNVSLPAIVLSHTLYGSIDQEEDIIKRNRIPHPLFVPGSQPIEVLING